MDAANTTSALRVALPAHEARDDGMAPGLARNMQVLSPKDADLYRAAFAAQQHGDWKAADTAIANLTDKRLLGHVLADRYQRRAPTASELRDWLASYGSLPEATDLYDEARHMAGAKAIKFQAPTVTDAWSGIDGYGVSADFRTGEANDNEPSAATHRFSAKINRALRHGQTAQAARLLETEQQRRAIPAHEMADIKGRIATTYFYRGETVKARKLIDDVARDQNPRALWIGGLAAWKQNDFDAAGDAFATLAGLSGLSSWDRAAAAFWAYRATRRSGESGEANHWLEVAAKQPHSFYGLMAAHLLGRDTGWSWQMPSLDARNIATLAARSAGWRALALLQIDQPALAESELRHLNPQGHRNLQEAMLALAETAHMPALALQLGGIATNDNGKRYDAALYPLPPWKPAQGFQVDPALIYALMRNESQFDPMAVSNRGACGLMQLMPATANLIANDNLGEDCSARLLDPAFNIALGQKYVRRLASQPMIGDNLLLLLAAYNSGPGKLARWMDDNAQAAEDPLLFIESLPVRETRDYVQQVLMHYWSYRARLAEPETTLAELAQGEWPHAHLRGEPALIRDVKAAPVETGFEVANLGTDER